MINRAFGNTKISNYIVPNAVDTQKFVPIEPNQHLKLKLNYKTEKIIGYIGSIRRIEGIEILFKSFALLKKKINDIKLLIVGPDNPRGYIKLLENYSIRLNIEKDVIFTGKVPYNEINKYYSIIDIFVIPRLNLRENRLVTPLKPLEVMAMEKLLFASDIPALRELIKHNISGILFETENERNLAESIEKYLINEEEIFKLQKKLENILLKIIAGLK